MALRYSIREERCTQRSDCDSGYCDGASGTCADYQASCLDLYNRGQRALGHRQRRHLGPVALSKIAQ